MLFSNIFLIKYLSTIKDYKYENIEQMYILRHYYYANLNMIDKMNGWNIET